MTLNELACIIVGTIFFIAVVLMMFAAPKVTSPHLRQDGPYVDGIDVDTLMMKGTDEIQPGTPEWDMYMNIATGMDDDHIL